MTAATREPVTALAQRLRAAAQVMTPFMENPQAADPGRDAAALLPHLVAHCHSRRSRKDVWLLLVAVAGAFPREEDLREVSRHLEIDSPDDAQLRLLDVAFELAAETDEPLEMDVVSDGVIVDVDFCARRDFHTGIQRVVRETVPRWDEMHSILPVAWTDTSSAPRRLYPWEVPNVMAYRPGAGSDRRRPEPGESRIVVPLNCTVVLPEIPEPEASDCYAAMAQWTDNRIVAVGYDMIPIVSADLRPGFEATRFVRYLNVIKHAERVAAISRSAMTEFVGFAEALGAQGLPGPQVTEVLLPATSPDHASGVSVPNATSVGDRPVVVCVGTHDPHKNHGVLVHAAERLWREGLDFELVFIGGVGFMGPQNLCFNPLIEAGRPVRNLGRVSDEEMSSTLRGAAFAVFLSLHEGYGLPVAEALACGTPVLTTNFGSLQEIAESGGCVTVDPRDDDAVTAAMRRLLMDRVELGRLRAEIAERPKRTWGNYAGELWDVVAEVTS